MNIVPGLPTATYLRKADGFWLGDARLYQLSTPLVHGRRRRAASKVIVHAIPGDNGLAGETVMFPACESGLLDTIAPVGGSPRRGCDHRRTLRAAGYEVVRAERAA